MHCMPLFDHTPPTTASHPSRNYVVEDCRWGKKSLVMERRTLFILHHALRDCTLLHHAPSQGKLWLFFCGAGGGKGWIWFSLVEGMGVGKGDSPTLCPGRSSWANVLSPLPTQFVPVRDLLYGKCSFPGHQELQLSACKCYFYTLMSFLNIFVGTFIAREGKRLQT